MSSRYQQNQSFISAKTEFISFLTCVFLFVKQIGSTFLLKVGAEISALELSIGKGISAFKRRKKKTKYGKNKKPIAAFFHSYGPSDFLLSKHCHRRKDVIKHKRTITKIMEFPATIPLFFLKAYTPLLQNNVDTDQLCRYVIASRVERHF